MLGSLESFKEVPIPTVASPPIYLINNAVVALSDPNPTLTQGLPFCEVVEGMPRWCVGSLEYHRLYRELKASLDAHKLTFTHLNGRLIYRARPVQFRRIPMSYGGLLINRMTQLAAELTGDNFDPTKAVKLYQMLGDSGRAVVGDHLNNGPIVNEGYEMSGYQAGLVTIGLLTRCVIKGKTGLTVANELGLRVYNAAITEKKERSR